MKNLANSLMNELTKDVSFNFPELDYNNPAFEFPSDTESLLYKSVKELTNEDLTSREVNGSGTFDSIMAGIDAHLALQWDKGRITGDEYSKVYASLADTALSTSVQFLINRDTTFWAAQAAQLNAITARVALEAEKAKLGLIQIEALKAKTEYAIAKVTLAAQSVEFDAAKFRVDNMLPKENQILSKNLEGLILDNTTKDYSLNKLLPLEADTKKFTLDNVLPAQLVLLNEQAEVQRSQTLDTRSDDREIKGITGKQKDLFDQQISSYKRESEYKATKIFADTWGMMKTMDESIHTPPAFDTYTINDVMRKMLTETGLNVDIIDYNPDDYPDEVVEEEEEVTP